LINRQVRTISLFTVLLLAASTQAQSWPGRIDGYKLHDPKIVLIGAETDAVGLKVTSAKIKNIGLAGPTVEIEAEILARKQGVDVEFVRFKDVRLNGIAVEPEEYRGSFAIKKGETRQLPKPVYVRVPMTSVPTTLYDQLTNPTSRLKITGTAFVFGKFKKLGLTFKRVAPIKLDLEIENPIKLR
jgi:hypothetical protein